MCCLVGALRGAFYRRSRVPVALPGNNGTNCPHGEVREVDKNNIPMAPASLVKTPFTMVESVEVTGKKTESSAPMAVTVQTAEVANE